MMSLYSNVEKDRDSYILDALKANEKFQMKEDEFD
jgi:hypothetical protein